MSAFKGELSEYRQIEPNRWVRANEKGEWLVEEGIVTVADGVTFEELYNKRKSPDPEPPDPRDVKLAALEARLEKLEAATKEVQPITKV